MGPLGCGWNGRGARTDYDPTTGVADGRRSFAVRTFDLEPNRRAWGLLANGLVECRRAGSRMRDVANVCMGLTGYGTELARRLPTASRATVI